MSSRCRFLLVAVTIAALLGAALSTHCLAKRISSLPILSENQARGKQFKRDTIVTFKIPLEGGKIQVLCPSGWGVALRPLEPPSVKTDVSLSGLDFFRDNGIYEGPGAEHITAFAGAMVYLDFNKDDAQEKLEQLVSDWKTEQLKIASYGKEKVTFNEYPSKIYRTNGQSYPGKMYKSRASGKNSYRSCIKIAVGSPRIDTMHSWQKGDPTYPVYYLELSDYEYSWNKQAGAINKILASFKVP